MGVAAKSNSEQRQVGCIIVNGAGELVAEGFNYAYPDARPDEHAEHAACLDLAAYLDILGTEDDVSLDSLVAYVTHPPCPDCARKLQVAGVVEVKVVEAFMKFDGDKVRYDLVPPKPIEDLAKVLTFGARKYKPGNWRDCQDLGRYEAALLRHIQAYRMGEKLDPETQLPHLAHAMCNLVFLMELD